MINFLLKTDPVGIITDIVWCDPAYLMFIMDRPVFEYFKADDHAKIENGIRQALESEISVVFQGGAKDGSDLRILMTRFEEDLLLFGYQSDDSNNIQEKDFIKTIQRFLDMHKKGEQKADYYGIEAQTLNFEKIQMLNNDLINMQRKLEKVNAQLNAANLLLNNRLVRDELTGLVSRYQYKQEIELLIRKFPTCCGIFAFLDVDLFKKVNDSYGHGVGDRFLIEFARRLGLIPIENMICIRISGDEFGLFQQGIALEEVDGAIVELWNLIAEHVLKQPVIIDDKSITLSASVGMAVYNLDTTNIYELIDYADFAMYLAKKGGKNRYVRFDIDRYKQIKEKGV